MSTIVIQFTPEIDMPAVITAPDESLTVTQNSASNSVTPVITQDGAPVTPDSLSIVTQPAHGAASVSGVSLLYTPATGYVGADSFTYKATVAGVDSNIATVSALVYALACDELGRSTRVNVSGYNRTNVHDTRLVRGEKRCLVANFNGAIPAGRMIASVIWRCAQPYIATMSNARIIVGARQAAIDVRANYYSDTLIKCEATLDNGEVMAQLMRISVQDSPWFVADTVSSAGPTTLTSP